MAAFGCCIKGNSVRFRNSTRYCNARFKEKPTHTTVQRKDGKVAFRVSQETCQQNLAGLFFREMEDNRIRWIYRHFFKKEKMVAGSRFSRPVLFVCYSLRYII